jgi:hypothetical protein
VPPPCGTASALDCHPRTSNSHSGIASHHYQDAAPRQRSTGSINRVKTVLCPRPAPGNRRALATFYSAPSRRIAPAPGRCKALADAPFRPPALASRPLTWKAKVGYVVDTTEWTSGRVLKVPATGIGEMPTPDRRDVSRRFRFTGGASSAALSPMIHGEVNAKLPRGASHWLTWFGGWLCRFSRTFREGVRSPANGLSRRFIALPTRLFFALHPCAPSACQNDKWPPEGRIRCNADYRFRHHT